MNSDTLVYFFQPQSNWANQKIVRPQEKRAKCDLFSITKDAFAFFSFVPPPKVFASIFLETNGF